MAPAAPAVFARPEARRAWTAALAAFLLVAAFTVLALARERTLVLQRALDDAATFTAVMEENTARTFDGVDVVLEGLAQHFGRGPLPRHDAASRALMQGQLRHLPTVRALYVIGPSGFIQHDTDYPKTPDVSLADRAYFRRFVDEPLLQQHLSEPLQSRSGTGWFLASSRRITLRDGSFGGIVVAAVQLDTVSRLYRKLGLGEGQRMSLFSTDARLLARFPSDDANIGRAFPERTVFADRLHRARSGVLVTEDAGDVPRVVGYRALENQPLVVLFSVTEESVLAGWRRTAMGSAVALGVLLVLLAAGVLLFVQRQEHRQRARQERAAAHESAALAQQLASADRQKTQFLATLSHELRNVLAPIQNGLLILAQSDPASANAQRARDIVQRQLATMRTLVDELLDMSRVNSGKVHLDLQQLDLCELLAQAAAAAGSQMEAAGHRFETSCGGPLWVRADRTRMLQVFANLLGNAAKYTPAGGRIALAARLENAEAVVEVSDNGLGIPEHALPKIFQMFEQVESHIGHSQGGLGIGLALVQRLVALHGGRVEAHSGGPGQGSRFVVRLPLAAAPESVGNPVAASVPG